MKSISNQIFEKTQNILFLDKVKAPRELTHIVSSDIFYVLRQYFDLSPQSYNAEIHVKKDGKIGIDISFVAERVLVKKRA